MVGREVITRYLSWGVYGRVGGLVVRVYSIGARRKGTRFVILFVYTLSRGPREKKVSRKRLCTVGSLP